MSEAALIGRQRAVLKELVQGAAARARAEAEVRDTFGARRQAADQEYQRARQDMQARLAEEEQAAEQEWQDARQRLPAELTVERRAAEEAYRNRQHTLTVRLDDEKTAAEKDFQETRWTLNTLFDSEKNESKNQFHRIDKVRRKITDAQQRVGKIRDQGEGLLRQWGQQTPAGAEPGADIPAKTATDPLKELQECIEAAGECLTYLKKLVLPRLYRVQWLILLFVLLAMAGVYPAKLGTDWQMGAAISAGGALVVTLLVAVLLHFAVRRQIRKYFLPLCQDHADAQAWAQVCLDQCEATHKKQAAHLEECKKRREDNLAKAKQKCLQALADSQQRHARDQQQATADWQRRLTEAQQKHDREMQQAEGRNQQRRTESRRQHDSDLKKVTDQYQQTTQTLEAASAQKWQALSGAWQRCLDQAREVQEESQHESRRLFPAWPEWQAASAFPPAIRFGELPVRMEQVPDGLPQDERLRALTPDKFTYPAWLAFPEQSSVLIRASDAGRTPAVQMLQLLMLRLLTALPPGKVRFTILDPIGLGENFAAFMHLADHDEALVNHRIWTEMQDIEQRLADLTDHMENVIQKYLRNQFQSIEEYNAQAGEVAEPYRFLVVANFPVNFSAEAARRLVSIAASGPGCGVYPLISVDGKQPLPPGFNLKDLEQRCVTFHWKDQRVRWKDEDFGPWPLELDTLPEPETFNRIVQEAGQKAKAASRVEVRFDFLAPTPGEIWSSDSRGGIRIPLGRAGATKKQYLQLGQGTSQHMLVAGKTGSGKSTFLHALITNLCLHYSPDQVELYLVDFKKGVEFKTYATHQLPHARVIAIESEREFGLSVLQRLDAELKNRGSRFRDLEVQDVKGFRQASGEPCPRILLIVDEFQEFFVEDDKIAQEASLLLDRLVRQGRAFGMHVLLGSQTLGGAYSLARATIDQMAVRVALQCSEVDAHLILSKDNSAARLLSRPGEAIYNDANGLVEGNNVFQVVWLPEDEREEFLQRMENLARERPPTVSEPPIVFEGNAPAELDKNPLLTRLLSAGPDPGPVKAARAWLGEALAIKDPTAALFRRQTGSNLLLIGQQEERSLSVLLSSLISLSAHHVNDEARFYVLDGSPPDAATAGWFQRVAASLPQTVRVGGWRDLAAFIAEIGEEVERRQKANDTEQPAIYLLIHGLHRLRDLRRGEDDFGFGRRDEPISPGKQWATIFREGPALGVFNLVWCDNLTNTQRALDRPGLREFEMRVLFQMSAADSSTLIDSPVAGKLGLHRALFYSEEVGQPEKFRPYGMPKEELLQQLKPQMHTDGHR